MSTYNLFSSITKMLRVLELFLVLFFLSWIITRLPFALRVSADFLGSPLFVFAISHAIIATLLAQSNRCFSTTDGGTTDTDHISNISSQSEQNSGAPVAEQVEFQDKQVGKVYSLSKSEKMKGEDVKRTARRKFRHPHDKLSNEEFQRTIEAFIAKQMRMLREESC